MEHVPLPASHALYERASRHIAGGSSRATLFTPPFPTYAVRGSGSTIIDADGRELIDMHGNYSSLVHGQAFLPVLDAAREALADGSCFGLPTLAEIELAEHLSSRVPWAPCWRFTGSGTEAVMAAVRAARACTGRDLIIRFAGCYHGGSDALLTPGAPGVPAAAQADVLTLPLGDPDALSCAVETHGDRLAAVLLDLMPNRAGLLPAERSFASLARELTAAHGGLLIVDEVITFRASPSGLHALYEIEPDLVTLGKIIGGGLPCGAVGGRSEVMGVFDPARSDSVALAGTFSANPLTMRAGLAALRSLDEPAIARIDALGERLRRGLRSHGFMIAGRGSLLKIQSADLPMFWRLLYAEGVLIAADGLCCVSTAMDESTIDTALERFVRAVGH